MRRISSDKAYLESGTIRIDADGIPAVLPPAGAIPGQLLMATSTGALWSWADRYPTTYHDQY